MARLPKGIARTVFGFRAYVRVNGQLVSKRFPPEASIREMKHLREQQRVELRKGAPVRRRPTLADDLKRYLAAIAAMPSLEDRTREIESWLPRFGNRSRGSITPDEVRAQLHAWRTEDAPMLDAKGAPLLDNDGNPRIRKGLSASTCNHRRTALLHLYRVLDGRAAYNPVREVPPFKEPPPGPRGVPLKTFRRILEAMPDTKTRARLAVLAFTAMRRSELAKMQPKDVDLRRGCCWVPTGKGGEPRLVMLNVDGKNAWKAFARHDAWGEFSKDSLRNSFNRACAKLGLEGLRPYDLRHSYATALRAAGADLADVQAHLGHSSPRMTKRYAPLVPAKLKAAVLKLA